MKKILFTILLLAIFGVLLVSSNADAAGLVPKINSIEPNPVYEYDYITISGENFEDCYPFLGGNNTAAMFLDGVKITSDRTFSWEKNKWTNGQIVYAVGSNGGKLKITNCDGLTSNEVDLVVTKKNPVLTSAEPNKGYAGSSIVVNGNDFGNTDPGSSYQFYLSGQHINRGYISSWTNNSFKLIIPSKIGNVSAYGDGEVAITPGNYDLQIQLGLNSNHVYEYSNKITITILESCTQDKWDCSDWNICSSDSSQTRICNKTFECPAVNTPSPSISQSCAPPQQPKPVTPVVPPTIYQPPQPSCTSDTWNCGDWNACSLSGVQNRSCRKTFDCPSAESAPPAVDQYCESPNRPIQQQPQVPQSSDEISNQDSIVRATVKLICPVDSNRASQGSGTLINSNGTILTNKHVVEGTVGCIVGFVDNFSDEPYFGERQIADIVKMSSSEDVAVLKIRNPQNTSLPYINIAIGNSKNLRLGTKIITYGYPSKFGTNITYTSGDFSGTNGNYLKTTAIIEHGNSGGGAYLKDGTFIGVPSAVIKGELNALGYVLSINTINAWLGNSSVISDSRPNNNYSRVSSVLETLDLNRLDSLQLVIPNTAETKKEPAPQVTAPAKISKPATPKPTEQTQKNISTPAPTKNTEQKVVENKKPEQSAITEKQEKSVKIPWPKRFLFWLANLF